MIRGAMAAWMHGHRRRTTWGTSWKSPARKRWSTAIAQFSCRVSRSSRKTAMTFRGFLAGAFALPAIFVGARAAEPPKTPLGLPPLVWPKDNPYAPEKAALGRVLYFDRRLSAD